MVFLPIGDDFPPSRPPVVTWTLLAACVLAYVWQATLGPEEGERVVYALGAIPAVVFGADPPLGAHWIPAYATLFSCMFLHGGIMHLLGNMLYLWIFGDNVEDSMGRLRFLVFYLLCGVIAALAHAITDPGSQVPMIGASGAISGVMGAYFLLHPHARVRALLMLGYARMVALPAWVVLGVWILMQGLEVFSATEGAGVAWWAHIGGFAAGAALIPLFKKRGIPLLQPATAHSTSNPSRRR